METANVPIILAIFHETQPNGWFWWSKGTGAELIALWKYTFNYLTVTKDLHNINLALSLQRSQRLLRHSVRCLLPGQGRG